MLDLDPGPGTGLAECAEVARWAREILGHMGLDPFPVTSGSKGIQLYSALPPGQTSEQASALAHELARAIEADHPDLVVSSMKKSVRDGRVLIDWSQNNGAKTTIAPYSLRGRAHPDVAAPRTWDELDDPDLRQLSFEEVLARIDDIGDPLSALGFHAGGRESDDGPLAAYISKRTAGKTPEPVPSDPAAATVDPSDLPRFVIQEHHATALHWDFRLEHDGVLVSWAVPRGVPPTPRRNSLAIMTEDHPMDYASFEGTIPAGEYGGGVGHDLGRRALRAREVARRRGHRDPRGPPRRSARPRASRPHPHEGRGREVAVASAPDEDGCCGPPSAGRRGRRGVTAGGRQDSGGRRRTRR